MVNSKTFTYAGNVDTKSRVNAFLYLNNDNIIVGQNNGYIDIINLTSMKVSLNLRLEIENADVLGLHKRDKQIDIAF